MKIIDEEENKVRIMSRIQCLRDKNLNLQETIESVEFLSIYCCNENGLTVGGEFITLDGEILTVG